MDAWKKDLREFFKAQDAGKKEEKRDDKTKPQVAKFYSSKVKRAFKQLKKELKSHGRDVESSVGEDSASIEVRFEGRLELDYRIKVRDLRPFPETHYLDKNGHGISAEGSFQRGVQGPDILDITEDDIIRNFLVEYKSRLWALAKKDGPQDRI